MTEELYRTSDLATAAFLLAHKEELVTTERDEKRMIFCFALNDSVEEKASEYINGGPVDGKAYFHALKDLKIMAIKGSD